MLGRDDPGETNMNALEVTVVRVYLQEGKGQLNTLMGYLHDESKVRGVTVFRGICGFGQSGHIHSSSLMDMSLDLPVVIEFFDSPEKSKIAIEHIDSILGAGHVVFWNAFLTTSQEHLDT
jgi:hypothetical protein